MAPGVGWSHNKGNHLYICIYREKFFENLLLKEPFRQKSMHLHGSFYIYCRIRCLPGIGWGHNYMSSYGKNL
jgi:hypothetical protein